MWVIAGHIIKETVNKLEEGCLSYTEAGRGLCTEAEPRPLESNETPWKSLVEDVDTLVYILWTTLSTCNHRRLTHITSLYDCRIGVKKEPGCGYEQEHCLGQGGVRSDSSDAEHIWKAWKTTLLWNVKRQGKLSNFGLTTCRELSSAGKGNYNKELCLGRRSSRWLQIEEIFDIHVEETDLWIHGEM